MGDTSTSVRNRIRYLGALVILSSMIASAAVAAAPSQVSVKWAQPAANATVNGTVQLRLTGAAFKNVEIFRSGIMIARAKVSSDMKSATAVIDTRQFANGPVTLTAHAWNSAAGRSFTSEDDAGALRLNINNSLADAPLSNTRDQVGVYVGNSPASITNFEVWLARDVDGILGYTGNVDWTDYDGSVGWAAHSLWSQLDRPVFWSIPLIPDGATLGKAAGGAYNEHYRRAARALIDFRPNDPYVIVRTGWEFNGDWFAWSAIGREKEFIGAYRQFVNSFRTVAAEHGMPNRFIFEWNVSIGNMGMNPETAYPGDAYVDIIGMDFYWSPRWDSKDPVEAWNSKLNQQYGLKWHQRFAARHGKRTAYSEWGVYGNNATPYIERAKKWFTKHAVVFHTYWDSNSAYPGKLSNEQYPRSAAAYYEAFHSP